MSNIPPSHSSPATGDLGLSCALNALGVPPANGQQFQPVKGADGRDFVRIYLGLTTIDGKRKTTDLMRQWRSGVRSIVANPSDPFSWLQIWTKTRSSLLAFKKGVRCYLGKVGGRPVVATQRDKAEWIGHEDGIELTPCEEIGIPIDDHDLAASLICLGAEPVGLDCNGVFRFWARSIGSLPEAGECLRCWPEMIADKDSAAAYFAAAAYARRASLAAIKQQDPVLYIKRMKEGGRFSQACISQRSLEEGDAKAAILARKIGL